jgi:hypothetical protein
VHAENAIGCDPADNSWWSGTSLTALDSLGNPLKLWVSARLKNKRTILKLALSFKVLAPEAPGPHPAQFLDIEMLVMTTGGRERTCAHYERLHAAGFRSRR